MSSSLKQFSARALGGGDTNLGAYDGKTILVVNVASQCAFTPQYEGLEALYKKFKDRGFEVLGFPCNQFGAQEPGTDQDIASFCTTKYPVSFPMFSKVEVNGPGTHPFWAWLKEQKAGFLGSRAIKWNFTKFLIGPDGTVRARFGPNTKPAAMEKEVAALLR